MLSAWVTLASVSSGGEVLECETENKVETCKLHAIPGTPSHYRISVASKGS